MANTCPAGSEIGTTKFVTDLVGDLNGEAYTGSRHQRQPGARVPGGHRRRRANLTVRVIGEVKVDPDTGATEAVFPNVPAVPVTEFTVNFVVAAPRCWLCRACAATPRAAAPLSPSTARDAEPHAHAGDHHQLPRSERLRADGLGGSLQHERRSLDGLHHHGERARAPAGARLAEDAAPGRSAGCHQLGACLRSPDGARWCLRRLLAGGRVTAQVGVASARSP